MALDANQALTLAVNAFLGEFGCAAAGVQLVRGDGARGIIRTNNQYIDHVKTALMTLQTIHNTPVVVQTVKVSGMLRKAEQGGK